MSVTLHPIPTKNQENVSHFVYLFIFISVYLELCRLPIDEETHPEDSTLVPLLHATKLQASNLVPHPHVTTNSPFSVTHNVLVRTSSAHMSVSPPLSRECHRVGGLTEVQ
jgi:hypothetical protein